jgi:O-antigen ligase
MLSTRGDLALGAMMLTLLVVDFSQVSYWSGVAKPFGEAQRWATVAAQAAYIAANFPRLRRVAGARLPLLGLIAFCAGSALWSVQPATSLFGAGRLLLLALGILLFQDRHGGPRAAEIFLVLCVGLLWANLAALALPGLSIMSGSLAGSFRGLTDHKNTLGQFCGLTFALVVAALATARTRPRVYALFLSAAALVACVALARSATAVVLCATAAALFAVVLVLGRVRLPILIGISVLAGVAVLGWVAGRIDLAALLGRDATLTGRAEIWAFVDLYVHQRPWLGYGYRAFPLSDLLRSDPRWGQESYVVGSTHNAYLAIVAEIGRVGLVAYCVWLLVFAARGFPFGSLEDRLRAAMVLGVYLVSGFTESFAGLSPGLYFAALLVAFHGTAEPTTQADPIDQAIAAAR